MRHELRVAPGHRDESSTWAASPSSAVSSSRAAGWRGTLEEFGKTSVREHVLAAETGVRPLRMLQEHLSAKFIRDAESLDGSEARDARRPVGILALADRGPVARDELTDATGDHEGIVTPAAGCHDPNERPDIRPRLAPG
jgi:hypothetical protein